MSYLVLARKYRPQTFEDVVGQNPVSQTLLNALETGRVAHAYIFSGPRGVGKTTTARILAKCLNCAKGPTKTPCNICDACVSISESHSTDDVLEIDGASNRGIEQIRELRENAKYAPARSRYRIFIIDEAHQITKDAFGALLKTLEEPPPHVVFMMATTEAHKIPAPILSRCQRFSLRPIAANLVFDHLKAICKKEKIKVEDEALAHIVRFVEGSLRDALSLLDQALVFSPGGITSQTIRDLLGLLPNDLLQNAVETMQRGEPGEILKFIHHALEEGIDLIQLAKDLQNFYHQLLLSKAGVEDTFKINTEEKRKIATNFDFPTLERNIRLLSKAMEDMRHSDTPRAIFEIYALRLGQKTLDPRLLIERLEKLETETPTPSATLSFSPKTTEPQKPMHPPTRVPPTKAENSLPALPKTGNKTENSDMVSPQPTAAGDTSSDVSERWPEFVDEITNTKATLGSALRETRVETSGSTVRLVFSKSFPHDLVARSQDVLKPAFEKFFGFTPLFDLKIDKTETPTPSVKAETSSTAVRVPPTPVPSLTETEFFEEVPSHQLGDDIQKVLKHFPGTVKRKTS